MNRKLKCSVIIGIVLFFSTSVFSGQWQECEHRPSNYPDVPIKTDTVKYVGGDTLDFWMSNSCSPTNIKVVGLRERVDYFWDSKHNSFDGHNHCNYGIVEVKYEVTCSNKLIYPGTKYLLGSPWHRDGENSLDSYPGFKGEQHGWQDLSLDYFNADGSISADLSFAPKLDFSALEKSWQGLNVTIPDLYLGEPGKLPRPVLLIHGLESDFKVWGVEAKNEDETSSDFQNGQVKSYNTGSFPYLFAMSYGLSTSSDKINSNGIYFYQAPKNSLLSWSSANSQSKKLYESIEQVLNSHFGDDWKKTSHYKIDLVAHSQGGLAIREMLRALPQSSSLANPANHINRVITVNTPHFGSALAVKSTNYIKDRFPGVALIINDLDNPQEHLLVEADVDADFIDSRLAGVAAAGWWNLLGFSTLTWSAIMGADIELTVKGPYLGPYNVKAVAKNFFGSSTVHDKTIKDSTLEAARNYMMNTRNNGKKELSSDGDFISNFSRNPRGLYPLLPNGEKLVMLPLYADSSHKILPELFASLGEEASRFCPKNEDGTKGCLAAASIFESYAEATTENKYDIDNPKFTDSLWNIVLDIQDGWLKQSDAIVEAESQTFSTARGGFSHNDANYKGFFLEPRNYAFHDKVMPYEAVLHGPKMNNDGATRQGMDLLCALTPVCSSKLKINGTLSLLQLVASASPRSVGASSAMSVDLTGNFDFNPVYIAKGKQGLALSVGSNIIVHAEYVPGKGSFINDKQIIDERVVTQPSMARKGDSVIVSFNNHSGKTFTTALYVPNLQNNVRISVLADIGAQMSTLAVSNGRATNPETQKPPPPPPGHRLAPVTLAAIHREARGEHEANTSRPRMLIYNATDKTQEFAKVAYYFTADPARKPNVVVDYPQVPVKLEHLGGDQWRFILDVGNQKIAGKDFYPSTEGWQIRMHYNDWYDFDHYDDWSADYSIGIPKQNRKIVIYDKNGKIIWGKEPTIIEEEKEEEEIAAPQATITWKDDSPWETNALKPRITVTNTGDVALADYHAELYFRVPQGKALAIPAPDDWYTPESTPSVKHVGNTVWKLDLHFDKHILYPADSVSEGNIGMHLTDWSSFDKTVCGVILKDSDGNILSGTEPSVAECESYNAGSILQPLYSSTFKQIHQMSFKKEAEINNVARDLNTDNKTVFNSADRNTISFTVAERTGTAEVSILNAKGAVVWHSSFSNLPVGANSINWNGANLPAGSYNMMLKTGSGITAFKFGLK